MYLSVSQIAAMAFVIDEVDNSRQNYSENCRDVEKKIILERNLTQALLSMICIQYVQNSS